ncbi:MAG TPA: dihydroneopterin triphosphate diphosphatase, partial [Gammaproteobacteria bacterium]|nr:dihydroneopterin triphosphate diphosphatase [Gammaproteobacteria bacterium]
MSSSLLRPPSGFKQPESVLVVVYTDSGETLLLQRAGGGFWQSVTGSLQSLTETPESAARRELYEETGIEADGGWRNHHLAQRFYILPEYRYRYGPGVTENLEHVFSLRLPERCEVTLNPAEHDLSRWERLSFATESLWSWT